MVLYIGSANTLDPLAQTVEHLTFNQGVRSSSLRWVTKTKKNIDEVGVFFCFIQVAGLVCNHASACMESPKAYGITEGVFSAA